MGVGVDTPSPGTIVREGGDPEASAKLQRIKIHKHWERGWERGGKKVLMTVVVVAKYSLNNQPTAPRPATEILPQPGAFLPWWLRTEFVDG